MPDMDMRTYEELQRYQLVTEFDIQSQSELDDYQVKLNSIDNPTQSQDNLVVGADGTPLNHWNESLDFDTWVKMEIGISGKRGLLIHGNTGLNSGSNGIDVFQFFDDATGTFSDNWNTSSDNLNGDKFSYESGYIKCVPASDGVCKIGIKDTYTISNDVIIDADVYISGTQGGAWLVGRYVDVNNNYEMFSYSADIGNSYVIKAVTGVRTASFVANVITEDVWHNASAVVHGDNQEIYADGNLMHSETFTDHASGKIGIGSYYSAGVQRWDNIRVRKYTATEPTVQISTPKNISIALKSFGRAG